MISHAATTWRFLGVAAAVILAACSSGGQSHTPDPELGAIAFTLPPDGQAVEAPTMVKVEGEGIDKVEFLLDSDLAHESGEAPHEWSLEPEDHAAGEHTLVVRVTRGEDVEEVTTSFRIEEEAPPPPEPPPPPSGDGVGKWERTVIALTDDSYVGNPFEVEVDCVFTHTSSGTELTLPGYYDGDDRWEIGFMPTRVGVWTYKTVSDDPDLDGQTGSIECVASGKPGLLKADSTYKKKWKYSDGAYAIPLAFRFDVFQEDGTLDRFKEIVDFIADDVKGHALEFTFKNEVFKDYQAKEFDLSLWNRLEDRMDALAERGLGIHFMLYSDDAEQPKWGAKSDEEKLLIRYLVARLAAYPVLVINTGIDLGEYRTGDWVDWYGDQFEALDPYGHPMSSRHGLSAQPDVMKDQTFSSEGDKRAYINDMIDHFEENSVPLSMDDAWHENSEEARRRDKDFSKDDIRRAIWKCVLAGGMGAIIRGSEYSNDDAWFRMSNFEEELESEDFLVLINPLVDTHLGDTFGAMVPEADLVSNGYCIADPDRKRILYMCMGENDAWDDGNGGDITVKLSGESGTWTGFWFDPRNGDQTTISDLDGGANHDLTPPSKDDWILVLKKK
ncbi:MAG: DUF5060 domain-containing protein [Planctomycetota bacterium]|jgi:hypothetical protein